MIKLSAATAAMLLLAALAASTEALARCDEDCVYERQEAAYERAYARAHGYDEEDDDYEGYGRQYRRAAPPSRRARKAAQPARPAELQPAAASPSQPKARAVEEEEPAEAEPAPAPRSRASSRNGPLANENSSIVVRSNRVAEDDTGSRPRPGRELGCKSFFPSVGMTLSVPCAK